MATLLPLEIEGSPFPLFGHSACLKPGSNHIYVYGGQNQIKQDETIFSGSIHVLSADEQLTWKKVARTSGATPLPTSHHSSTFINNKMYVFGGVGEKNQALSNEIYVLNQDAFLWWYKPRIDNLKPKARYGHTIVAVSTALHLFGGRDETDAFNDTFVLDTDELEWHEVQASNATPTARYFHSAVVYGTKIYVFGGTDGTHYFNDLSVFDTEKREWRNIECEIAPAPRAEHAAVFLEGEHPKMLIHGGRTADGYLNDFFLFDISREVWQRWHPSTTPLPRAACSLIQTKDRVLILGGYNSNWVTPPSTVYAFSASQVAKQAQDCTAADVVPVTFIMESVEQETKIELSVPSDASMHRSKTPLSSPRTQPPSMNSSTVSVDELVGKDLMLSTSGLTPKATTPRSGSTSPRVVPLGSSGAVSAPPHQPSKAPGSVSMSLPLGLNLSNQSDLSVPEITAVQLGTTHSSPSVTWRELYEQEKDERMKFQTKLALVENKVDSLQSGNHQSAEALTKQLQEREMELDFLKKKIALLRGDDGTTGGDSTESKSLMMDLTFLWKRHEQYVKQRDELNKLISASEKMIQRKIEEIGSLFTRGSAAEEHNLVIPNFPSTPSSATTSTATTPSGSLANSTASLSTSSTSTSSLYSIKGMGTQSGSMQGALPPINSTPRPDPNTPTRDSFGRNINNGNRARFPTSPVPSPGQVTSPTTGEKKKQKDKKDKKDKKLKGASGSPPGTEKGSLRVTSPKAASSLKKRGTSTYFESASGSDEITQSSSPRRQTIFNIPFVPPQRAQTFQISLPFVEKCLNFLESYIETEGIFRVSANADQVSEFCKKYTNNIAADFSGENHTVVAAALKLYLRDLNDPVVPTILFDKIAAALKLTDQDAMNTELKSLMDILPPDCYNILAKLFKFLSRVEEQKEKNKMDAKNLSIVFGPALLRPDKQTLEEMVAATSAQNLFVQKCVENFDRIFTKS